MKNIRFAFAIDANRQYANKNFSMADFFRLYEYQFENAELVFISDVPNPGLTLEEEQKFTCLINFLKDYKIDFLIARNYSKKLKAECEFFVPVIFDKQLPLEQICNLVNKNIMWLIDELSLNKKENMVFNITNGIYKYRIDNKR